MRSFSFERLDVWNKSRILTKEIYLLSSKFPIEEKFGLTNQIRRASVSISSNLAEGSSRHSSKDQARFTEIAYGSLMEVLNHLITAQDLNFINNTPVEKLRPLVEEISNKLNRLRESQIRRGNS